MMRKDKGDSVAFLIIKVVLRYALLRIDSQSGEEGNPHPLLSSLTGGSRWLGCLTDNSVVVYPRLPFPFGVDDCNSCSCMSSAWHLANVSSLRAACRMDSHQCLPVVTVLVHCSECRPLLQRFDEAAMVPRLPQVL